MPALHSAGGMAGLTSAVKENKPPSADFHDESTEETSRSLRSFELHEIKTSQTQEKNSPTEGFSGLHFDEY
jgi:hypothetical protein